MALDVPRPELDDVAVGIGDVQGATAIVVGERNDFRLASLVSQSLDRGMEIRVVDLHRVVNVESASGLRNPDLRPPETDSGSGSSHQPHPAALVPPFDDRETENVCIEPLCLFEVEYLEHQLAHPGDGDSGRHAVHSERSRAGRIPEQRVVDTRLMARFVLVHGAWHGGWCFRRLAEELEDRGHHVAAPDLPCEEVGLTPLDYARQVGPQPGAIVVGHSLGGLTIPHVEARVRVYLAALPPLEGVYDECFAEGFGGTMRDSRDRSYWPDADTAAARMYPDCSRTQSDWAFAQLRRQARVGPVPALFGPGDVVIATLRDAAVDPDWQIRTARTHGACVLEL